VCYTTPPNAPPTSATDLTRMYTGAQARLHMNGGHMDLEALDDGDREKLGALPLEQCADACHLHGWCNERTQCTCFEGWNVRPSRMFPPLSVTRVWGLLWSRSDPPDTVRTYRGQRARTRSPSTA
jgi:hypothetical protein